MIQNGIDRITDTPYRSFLDGRRIGLVSNMSGISPVHGWRSTVDALPRLFSVACLFAPEHGVRGMLGPGEKVPDSRDELTELHTFSLFEDMVFSPGTNSVSEYTPQDDSLRGLDMLVFDMQDVGSRYFTYASTLLCTMRACSSNKVPLCVLDRPNPLGGLTVEGGRQAGDCVSFIGLVRMPIRHALTLGELARYCNDVYDLHCDLTVIPCGGLRRSMLWADTGLPFVKPSPNLPSPDAVSVYNGTCMLAGTNVSEGRGTTTPFTTIGAPFIKPELLADTLNSLGLPGIAFSPAFFRPAFGKYSGEVCKGVNIHVLDARAVRAVSLGVYLIDTLKKLFPSDFSFTSPRSGTRWHIDLSTGGHDLRAGMPPRELLAMWDEDGSAFAAETDRYRIYS